MLEEVQIRGRPNCFCWRICFSEFRHKISNILFINWPSTKIIANTLISNRRLSSIVKNSTRLKTKEWAYYQKSGAISTNSKNKSIWMRFRSTRWWARWREEKLFEWLKKKTAFENFNKRSKLKRDKEPNSNQCFKSLTPSLKRKLSSQSRRARAKGQPKRWSSCTVCSRKINLILNRELGILWWLRKNSSISWHRHQTQIWEH